jgi:hypothetical protein
VVGVVRVRARSTNNRMDKEELISLLGELDENPFDDESLLQPIFSLTSGSSIFFVNFFLSARLLESFCSQVFFFFGVSESVRDRLVEINEINCN